MEGDEICLLENRLKKEKDPKVRDRIRMMILLKEGYKQKEVAKIMRTTERTVDLLRNNDFEHQFTFLK